MLDKSIKKCNCGQVLIDKDKTLLAYNIQTGNNNGVISCPKCQRLYNHYYKNNEIFLIIFKEN